ncbi:MAG: class I SAM-dependent methyltransferase [Bryobacteraceae bacterium]
MAHGFDEYYQSGDTPWDIGKPDFNLIQIVTTTSIKPCRALEIGCGTGDNAIWLAQQKFDVLAFDASEVAIEKAREKAQQAGVQCSFRVADILKSDLQETPFGFAFDRGCFHTLDSGKGRKRFAQQVHLHLADGGLWLSLIGSADDERLDEGPPKLTARDIVDSCEPYFEILSMVSSHFETHLPVPARAWICLMRKRKSGE